MLRVSGIVVLNLQRDKLN